MLLGSLLNKGLCLLQVCLLVQHDAVHLHQCDCRVSTHSIHLSFHFPRAQSPPRSRRSVQNIPPPSRETGFSHDCIIPITVFCQRRRKQFSGQSNQLRCITSAAGLIGRVHSQLRNSHIRCLDRDMLNRDVPQSGPAGNIRVVGKHLELHPCLFRQDTDDCRRDRVRGILLISAIFYHYAAA